MNTISASSGKWEDIYRQLDLPPKTGNKHYKGECPLCGKKGKFRFDDRNGDGDWICSCGSGKGLALIQKVFQLSFEDACLKVDKIIDNTQDHQNTIHESNSDREEKLFNTYQSITGSPVETYLRNRCITKIADIKNIKFCSSYEHDHITHVRFQAMIARVTSFMGSYAYKHITFLCEGQKIKIDPGRKMFKIANESSGAVIKLSSLGKVLGIAEGIETALSASEIYNIPVWSTINTTLMRKFVCPKEVETLIVFADNDKSMSGLAAAFDCGKRNMLSKNNLKEINIVWPKQQGDFNDSLKNRNFNINKHKFTKC